LLVIALGCAASRKAPPPGADLLVGAEEATFRSNFPDALAQLVDSPQTPAAAGENSSAADRNILVLSGGGRDGAYSAGVLAGWSAAGTRPTFDVVTGISTGAIIAPLAFLGPRYDRILADRFTTVRTEDIYRSRLWLAVLWSDSLADSGPLRRLIDEHVTDGLLAEIAQAHHAGRRLYVGTTNLDTGRLTVWDLGAVAAGSDPKKRDLFRKVILASCSIPGLLPPVPIEIEVDGRQYTELHADGGISATMFLRPFMVSGNCRGGATNVYLVIAGKQSPEPRYVKRRFFAVSGASLEELLESRTQGDHYRIFLLCRLAGGRFAVTSIPQELPVDPDSTRFDPTEMGRLFEAGYSRAANGTAWRPTPPGVIPEEWLQPRTGTRFNTPSTRANY
jgi:predicted acylesterase/phospholipase RssA